MSSGSARRRRGTLEGRALGIANWALRIGNLAGSHWELGIFLIPMPYALCPMPHALSPEAVRMAVAILEVFYGQNIDCG
jgi:hypothetical protein